MAERPLGVTILGILWIIAGLLSLMGGLGIVALGTVLAGPIGGVIGLVFGFVFIIIGIISIFLGIGCFKGWGWVWMLGVIVTIIGLVMGIYHLFSNGASALLGVIIYALILWYLFQQNVKAYFGRV